MKTKRISLNELMGSAGESAKSRKLGLDDLPEILGEKMPDIKHNPIGRMRLINALKNRFGSNWRTLPGVNDIIKEFDKEAAFSVKLAEMRMIKGNKKES